MKESQNSLLHATEQGTLYSKEIKDILGINSGPVTERIVDAIIKAMINGNKDQAEKLLQQKISIDARSTDENTKIPQNIADQMISTIEDYLKEKGVEPKKPTPLPDTTQAPVIEKDKQKKKRGGDMKNTLTSPIQWKSNVDVSSVNARSNEGNINEEEFIPLNNASIVNEENTLHTADTERPHVADPILEETKTATEQIPLEEKEGQVEKFNNFDKALEEIAVLQTIGKRNKTAQEKIDLWQRKLKELGFGDVSINLVEEVEDTEAKAEQEARLKTITEIGKVIKDNKRMLDKFVMHGYSYEDNGELKSNWDVDWDTRGVLFLLDEARISFKEYEKTHKGSKIDDEQGKVIFYGDVGGKTLSIAHENGGTQIYNDHHQRHYSEEKTSATKQQYQILFENGLLNRQEWLDNLVEFINREDNLSYVDDKRFTHDYFEKKFASSLFGLHKKITFDQAIVWFKQGRDPFNPKFTEEELNQNVKTMIQVDGMENDNGKKSKMKKEVEMPLKDIIAQVQKDINNDVGFGFNFAIEKMRERGIKEYTEELGKVFYNTFDFQKRINKKNNKSVNVSNKIKYPFHLAKVKGYDTYVGCSDNTKKYFINSTTYNLDPIDKRIAEFIPKTLMVGGVMILPPQRRIDREIVTEELMLKILKMKE